MSTTSATVETLTAEVRVLMVGNRQVTLSVYRQLDTVPATEVEPFGRVRDKAESGREVIGQHTTTGALVRSIKPPKPNRVWLNLEEPDIDFNHESETILKEDGITVVGTFLRHGSRLVYGNSYGSGLHYRDDDIREYVEGRAREAIAQRIADLKRWEAWADLPLIVLAGLR